MTSRHAHLETLVLASGESFQPRLAADLKKASIPLPINRGEPAIYGITEAGVFICIRGTKNLKEEMAWDNDKKRWIPTAFQ